MRRFQAYSRVNVALALSALLGGCTSSTADDHGSSELSSAIQALDGDLTLPFTPRTAAALTGRIAGAAVTVGPLASQPLYAETLVEHFGDITPENETKWGELQPNDPRSWSF